MNSKKRLIKEINNLKKRIDYQRRKAESHHQYFKRTVYNKKLLLLATLLPVFIVGWNKAKVPGNGAKIVRPLAKFLFTLWLTAQRRIFMRKLRGN